MDLDDILQLVLAVIDSGSAYKACRGVCKRWRDLADVAHPDGNVKWANHLTTLLKMFPDAEWYYYGVLGNPNISFEYATAHSVLSGLLEEKWYREVLAFNCNLYTIPSWSHSADPKLTWVDIATNPHGWNWTNISMNTFGKKRTR